MAKNIVELPPVSEAMSCGYRRMSLIQKKKNRRYDSPAAPWPAWAIVYGAGLTTSIPAVREPWRKLEAMISIHWLWMAQPFLGPLPCGCLRTIGQPPNDYDSELDPADTWAYEHGADLTLCQISRFFTPTAVRVLGHLWSYHRGDERKGYSHWSIEDILGWVRHVEAAPLRSCNGFAAGDEIRARGLGISLG